MSKTPIFDAAVKASDPDLHKASTVFPQPSTHWSTIPVDPRYFAKVTGEFPKPKYADWFNVEWEGIRSTVIARIVQKPESTWKTFLRCLLWWKP